MKEHKREMEKRRYGVLLCGRDSEYVKNKYGGYFEVFVALLGEEGEDWDLYRVAELGELPKDDDIVSYDGFVISGSCSDAHADDDWILRLLDLLRKLHSMRKKVLGFCFGHQILSRALGGKTGRSSEGWDIGVTCIHPSPSATLRIPSHLPIIECHRDVVLEPPPHAEVLARSAKTAVEMFRFGDHAMGIQGHPEYTKDILLDIVDRLLKSKSIPAGRAEAVRASLNGCEPDREEWKRLCRCFLKGRTSS